MSTFKAGDNAFVTALNRTQPYRAYFDGQTWREYDSQAFCVDTPATIRPLVVLDPHEIFSGTASKEDRTQRLVRFLREMREWEGQRQSGGNMHIDALIYQIEAQTKPPRIPEPGWGAIVEAGVKEHDVRLLWTPNDQGFWACKDPDEYARNWGELIDPTLVRDGIDGGAS